MSLIRALPLALLAFAPQANGFAMDMTKLEGVDHVDTFDFGAYMKTDPDMKAMLDKAEQAVMGDLPNADHQVLALTDRVLEITAPDLRKNMESFVKENKGKPSYKEAANLFVTQHKDEFEF